MNKRNIKIGDKVRIIVEQNLGKRKYLNLGSEYYVTSIYLPHYIAVNEKPNMSSNDIGTWRIKLDDVKTMEELHLENLF